MNYAMPQIGLVTRDDISGIFELQEENMLDRGGMLTVRFSPAMLEAELENLPQIVARRDGKVVGYMLAASRGMRGNAPIMQAMFHAYPGSPRTYIYGPVCVADSERGQGLVGKMFEALVKQLPGRECVTFVRRDNAPSLRAHLKMGMRDVASFTHDGVLQAVLVHP